MIEEKLELTVDVENKIREILYSKEADEKNNTQGYR